VMDLAIADLLWRAIARSSTFEVPVTAGGWGRWLVINACSGCILGS
jgi:hypothetical protein